jgi:hypothetical protein
MHIDQIELARVDAAHAQASGLDVEIRRASR